MKRYSRQFIPARFPGGSLHGSLSKRHLNPGTGCIEQVEIDWVPCCDDGSLPEDSALHRWSSKLSHAMEMYSRPIRVQPELVRHQLEAVGFVDIEEAISRLYFNPWPSNESDKEIGKWFNLAFSHSLEALSICQW
jgi:hypothetical protein